MNKRIIATVLTFAMLLLTGCQLAVAGAEEPAQPDRLIGAFITTEYIDNSNMEDYFRENAGAIVNGSSPNIDAERRIYAVMTDGSYEFEGLEGMLLISYWKCPGDMDDIHGYWTSDISEGLSEVHNQYHSSDTGASVKQSASIYLPYHIGEVVFYPNPVYQTADGEVYLLPGTGISMSTALAGEMKETLSSQAAMDYEGEEIDYSYEVEVTVSCVDVPTKVVLIQMDENHQQVRRDAYIPGQLPDEITPEKNTCYILVEEHCADRVLYKMCQPGTGVIEVFFRMENNICIKDNANVNWAKE